jgi:hypothetical protein
VFVTYSELPKGGDGLHPDLARCSRRPDSILGLVLWREPALENELGVYVITQTYEFGKGVEAKFVLDEKHPTQNLSAEGNGII